MIGKDSAITLRKQLGMTQNELGKMIKANQVTVSRYETGAVPVAYKYVKRIAEASGYDVMIRVKADGESEAYIPGVSV